MMADQVKAQEILASSQAIRLINQKSHDGFTPLDYALINKSQSLSFFMSHPIKFESNTLPCLGLLKDQGKFYSQVKLIEFIPMFKTYLEKHCDDTRRS